MYFFLVKNICGQFVFKGKSVNSVVAEFVFVQCHATFLLNTALRLSIFFFENIYSRRRLSSRACKSASASETGELAFPPPPPVPPPVAPPPPDAPAPIAAACGCFEPATDNDPDA